MTTRPAEYYVHGDQAVIPGHVAAMLNQWAGLNRYREQNPGRNPDLDEVLRALLIVERRWRASATGSRNAAKPEVEEGSNTWMTTTRAADRLGITDRAVRTAIDEKRLPAEKVDGRWRISTDALALFRARSH